MRRKLDLAPHELYEMRKQGMTNKQIADALGVSQQTVWKYLKGFAKGENKKAEGVSKLPSAEKLPEVMVLKQTVAINGLIFEIEKNTGEIKVYLPGRGYPAFGISRDGIDDLISALKAVKTQL